MKTNKTIKYLMTVGLAAMIAGCNGSDGGSKDGSAAGLDMLDLTTVDQEELAKIIHFDLTESANDCGTPSIRHSYKLIEPSNKKVKEDLESGPCEYGGSINVIENALIVNDKLVESKLEVAYDKCARDPNGFTNGYMKEHSRIIVGESVPIEKLTGLKVYKDGYDGWDDYICTDETARALSASLEVSTGNGYYKYSRETKLLNSTAEILYNIDGYKTYLGGFVHVKADAIIESREDKGCRTDGVVHLTGKNNSKVTIQYNADRSMDFTLNGKKEHWYNCMQKNP